METRQESKANPRIVAAVWFATIVAGWLVWRPAGAFLAVMSLGNLRGRVELNALFWDKPRYPIVFGLTAGLVGAVVTQAASRFAFSSPWGPIGLTVLGFLAVGYIGYGVSSHPRLQSRWEQYQMATRGAAVTMYLLASAAVLVWAFTHSWYTH